MLSFGTYAGIQGRENQLRLPRRNAQEPFGLSYSQSFFLNRR